MRHAYTMLDGMEERPLAIRAALHLGPAGTVLLMLAAFIASSAWVCKAGCVHVGDEREDKLLECMDQCEVQGLGRKERTCQNRCHSQHGFTRRQVRHAQAVCEEECVRHPAMTHLVALLGTASLLVVSPLISTYRRACRCECCSGQGCTARLATFVIGWVAYGFSILWAIAAIIEKPSKVGGKVLFGLGQGISIPAMLASRSLAQQDEARASAVGEPTAVIGAPGSGAQPMSVMGAPVDGPSNEELQAQIQQLQQQVKDLAQLQALRAEAAVATAAPGPATAPAGDRTDAPRPPPLLL